MPNDRVPILIGNLGARAIMATAKGERPERDPLLDALPRYAAFGVAAIEDYVGWSVVEPAPERFDFSIHLAHRDAARRAGLGYVVYAWLHALPLGRLAARSFEPFVCVEHGLPCGAPSIFAPDTLALLERFLARIRVELGDDLYQLTLACPCDYGEVGFPTGMGAWVQRFPAALDHWHEGFWCGDAAARAAHRERFGSDPPADPWQSGGERLAFDAWYRAAPLAFMDRALAIARRLFPRTPLGLKCGYGGEKSCYGQDPSGLARLAASHGASVWSTHGTLPTLHHKRIQSACRVFAARYCTEGITERDATDVRNRLFEDAADGASAFFEFDETFRAHAAEFERHSMHLTGEAPRVDVVVLFDGAGLALEPRQSLPPRLQPLAEPLRDRLDFDVIDAGAIGEPRALDQRGVLAIPDARPTDAAALRAIAAFVDRGGIVVLPAAPGIAADPFPANPALPPAHELLRYRSGDADAVRIEFGRDDEWFLAGAVHGAERAAPYFGGGDDERCRWIGGAATLRVPRGTAGTSRPLVIELFAPRECRTHDWSVSVDGARVAAGLAPGASIVRADIAPDRDHARGVIVVRFEGPTFRPHEHDARGDHRSLGLLLRRVTLGDGVALGPPRFTADADVDRLRDACLVRRGRGGFLFAPQDDLAALVAAIHAASTRRSRLIDGAADFPDLDGFAANLRFALSARRLLAYNRGGRSVTWERRTIGPHEIVELPPSPMR